MSIIDRWVEKKNKEMEDTFPIEQVEQFKKDGHKLFGEILKWTVRATYISLIGIFFYLLWCRQMYTAAFAVATLCLGHFVGFVHGVRHSIDFRGREGNSFIPYCLASWKTIEENENDNIDEDEDEEYEAMQLSRGEAMCAIALLKQYHDKLPLEDMPIEKEISKLVVHEHSDEIILSCNSIGVCVVVGTFPPCDDETDEENNEPKQNIPDCSGGQSKKKSEHSSKTVEDDGPGC